MHVIRVVIADDDARVRSALSEVLDADPRFSVVGTAATGDELAATLDAVASDVVLLDVRMPGGGAEAATAISSRPDAPIVIAVSAQTGAASVAALIRAGAVGYLGKGRLAGLPDQVARCAAGEVVLAVPSGAEALQQVLRPAPS